MMINIQPSVIKCNNHKNTNFDVLITKTENKYQPVDRMIGLETIGFWSIHPLSKPTPADERASPEIFGDLQSLNSIL